MTSTRRPTAFRLPETEEIELEPDLPEPPLVPVQPQPLGLKRSFRWGSLLVSAATSLIMLWAGFAVTGFIEDLFARSVVLGGVALSLAGLIALTLVAILLREVIGLIRLNALGTIQDDAAKAIAAGDAAAAQQALRHLRRLYGRRPELAAALVDLDRHEHDIMDPADRMRIAERDIVSRLDETAGRVITRASRRVTLTTAVMPAAALDILFVAAINLRMLRDLATLYGGRPGFIGTLRLARMVLSHLAVTGGLALTDNIVQHVLGRGLIGRLSARFGEGAVNGIMTARIGLAALDICRPLPFITRPKPGLAEFLQQVGDFSPERERPA
ncbi:MAG: TIGR01620 family protein [Aestuariivirgaceae bacterium]